MRSAIYSLLYKFRFLFASINKNKIRVLAYHTVPDPYKFEQQLKFLSQRYNIISINQLLDFLLEGKELPKNAVLITFDDGDISVFEDGLPLLKKYNFPSVLFVVTGLIDTLEPFWWKRVEEALQLEGKTYEESRQKVKELKALSNKGREDYLKNLRITHTRQLRSRELREMEEAGMFIGNHTHSHPMIDKCTELEVKTELKKSRESFKKWNLSGFSVFAYPNGNWDKKTERLLKASGIKIAFLFDHKLCDFDTDPLRISRIKINTNTELNEFKTKVSGVHSVLWNMKNY